MDLVFSFHKSYFFLVFGFLFSVLDNSFGFLFCGTDSGFSLLLTVIYTDFEHNEAGSRRADNERYNSYYEFQPIYLLYSISPRRIKVFTI